MVPLNRSLRILRPMLREGSSLTPSTKNIFHRHRKIRDDVKLGDIEVSQSTYKSQCVRSFDCIPLPRDKHAPSCYGC